MSNLSELREKYGTGVPAGATKLSVLREKYGTGTKKAVDDIAAEYRKAKANAPATSMGQDDLEILGTSWAGGANAVDQLGLATEREVLEQTGLPSNTMVGLPQINAPGGVSSGVLNVISQNQTQAVDKAKENTHDPSDEYLRAEAALNAAKAAAAQGNTKGAQQTAESVGFKTLEELESYVNTAPGGRGAVQAEKDKQGNIASAYYHTKGWEDVTKFRSSQQAWDLFKQAVDAAYEERLIAKNESATGASTSGTVMLNFHPNAASKPYTDKKNAAIDALTALGFDSEIISSALTYAVDQKSAATAEEVAAQAKEFADKHPVAGAIGSIVLAPLQGADYVASLVGNIGHNNAADVGNYNPLDASDFMVTGSTQALREGVTADMGNVGKFLMNTGFSMVDSAIMAATLGPAGGAVLGLSAASNTAKDVMERGGTNGQALLAGAAAGVAEAAFEKLSIEKLLNAPKTGVKGEFWLNMARQAFTEASEEACTEIANILADAAIMGQNSNFNAAVKAYLKENPNATKEEATRKAFLDNVAQVALAAAGGALSGAGMTTVFNGAPVLLNKATDYAVKNQVGRALSQNQYDMLVVAQRFADGSDTRVLADKIATSIEQSAQNGKVPTISAATWGELATLMESQRDEFGPKLEDGSAGASVEQALHPDEAVMSATAEVFRDAGDDPKTADTKSKILDKIAAGDTTVTDTELRKLDLNSQSTRAAFKTVLGVELPGVTDRAVLFSAARNAAQSIADAKAAAEQAQPEQVTAQPEQVATPEQVQTPPEQVSEVEQQVQDELDAIEAEARRMADAVAPAAAQEDAQASAGEIPSAQNVAENASAGASKGLLDYVGGVVRKDADVRAQAQKLTVDTLNNMLANKKSRTRITLQALGKDGVNGQWTDDGNIVLNSDRMGTGDAGAQFAIYWTLTHELFHEAVSRSGGESSAWTTSAEARLDELMNKSLGSENWAAMKAEAYDAQLAAHVNRNMTERKMTREAATEAAKQTLTDEFMREEYAADALRWVFFHTDALNKFAGENRGIVVKIRDWLQNKFSDLLAGNVAADKTTLRTMNELVKKVNLALTNTEERATDKERSGVKFSVTPEMDAEYMAAVTNGDMENDDIRYSAGAAPSATDFIDQPWADPMYSLMAKVVADSKQDKFGASSVIPMLRGKGVKQDEIKWSGIEQFLEGKKSVTKDELLEFIKLNSVDLEEVALDGHREAKSLTNTLTGEVYDSVTDALEIAREWAKQDGHDPDKVFPTPIIDGDWFTFSFDVREDDGTETHIMSADGSGVERNPQWEDYATPGGDGYREYLYRMPGSEYTNDAMRVHWGNTGVGEGVLAHARVQDFETPDGWMLFIDEIQSDWHNEGQKRGYKPSKAATMGNTRVESEDGVHRLYVNGERTTTSVSKEFLSRRFPNGISDEDIHRGLLNNYNRTDGDDPRAPGAPYAKNYHEYVLKRLLRTAAENGYDSIGWTTGKMQEDRWSSEYAEGYRIEYDQDIPKFLRKYGKQWGAEVGKTRLKNNGWDEQAAEARADEIRNTIELYESELDGFRAVGRSDPRIEATIERLKQNLADLDGTEVWTMRIPDQMRNDILVKGQPKFSAPTLADTNTPEFRAWFNDDSGELTNPDGTPKMLLRGSPLSGSTKFRDYRESYSPGIFLTPDLYAAKNYATARSTRSEPTEFIPRVLDTWRDAYWWVENGGLGNFVSLEQEGPDEWVFAKRNAMLPTRWDTVATFSNDQAGLDKFNAEYGDLMRNEVFGTGKAQNPGYMKLYATATKTKVIDAEGRVWLNADGQWGKTDDVVRQAWDEGYDCVVIKNVQDGGEEIGVGFDENDNWVTQQKPIDVIIVKDSGQVKSVYNTGAFDRSNPDVRYSAGGEDAPGTRQIPWAEQVDLLTSARLNSRLRRNQRESVMYVLRDVPKLLSDAGLSDLPLITTQSHARDVVTPRYDKDGRVVDEAFHDLSPAQLKRLPDMITDPVAVYAADPNRHHGGLWILTNEVDTEGYPIFVAIKPDQKRYTYDGVEGPAHFVNIFARKNYSALLENIYRTGGVIFQNRKKVNALVPEVRALIDRHTRRYGVDYDVIIRRKDPTVKPSERKFSADPKKPTYKTGGNTGNVNPDTGFERGSVADSFVRMWNVGAEDEALNMLESMLSRLAQINAEQAEERVNQLRRAAFAPRVTESVAERNKARIERLIEKYGAMEQTSAAQQEVRIPKQIDPQTRVAGAVQTAMAAEVTNEVIRDEIIQDILNGSAGVTYSRVGDKTTLDAVDKEFEKRGFDAMMRDWRNQFESDKAPTKLDIARAEKLYVEACEAKDVDNALKLVAEIADAGTRAGQAVQAMTLLKKMTPTGQLYYIQKAVDRLNREPRQKNAIVIDEALAKKLVEAKTREELNAAVDALIGSIAEQVPVSLQDKWNTWRYFAMLGNPRTHIRNLLGNVVFTPARLAKDIIGTGLEHMLIKDEGQRTKSITVDKAMLDFTKQDAEEMQDILRGGGKYNPSDMIRDRRKIFKRAEWLNKATGLNSELLEKEDWIFLKAAYARSMAGFLTARGVTSPDTLMDTKEGRKLFEDARAYAVREAQRATYRDASKMASTLNSFKRNHAVLGALLDGLVPFTKTPINIVKRGLEYSPIGLLKTGVDAVTKLRNGEMTAAEVIDELAANLTGTGVALLGALLSHFGLLVSGLGADDEDKFKELYGEQAYSLNIPGVGSYTIDWMAPVALPLFVGSEIYNTLTGDYSDVDAEQVLSAVMDGMASILEPMLSLSMLDGLNDALSANKFGDSEDALWTMLASMSTSYVSQGLPTVFGQIARTADPTRRTTFIQQGEGKVEGMLKRFWQSSVQGKVPFYENGKMAYVDAWGRTDTTGNILVRAFENFISPGYVNASRQTDVEVELARLSGELKDTGVLPDRAAKYFTVDKEKYAMTQDEYEAHLIDRGQTSYRLVSDFIHDPLYASLSDEERADVIKDIYEYAAQNACYNTNAGYDRNPWVTALDEYVANGGDAVDYLSVRVKSGNGVSMSEVAYGRDDLSQRDVGTILRLDTNASQRAPEKFADPGSSGREYSMTAEQQAYYTDLWDDLFNEEFADLYNSRKYQNADPEERAELVKELRADVTKEVKRDVERWLRQQGVKSTKK